MSCGARIARGCAVVGLADADHGRRLRPRGRRPRESRARRGRCPRCATGSIPCCRHARRTEGERRVLHRSPCEGRGPVARSAPLPASTTRASRSGLAAPAFAGRPSVRSAPAARRAPPPHPYRARSPPAPRRRRRHLLRHLVGLELDQRVVLGDRVADLLQPGADDRLGAFLLVGDADFDQSEPHQPRRSRRGCSRRDGSAHSISSG